MFERVAIRSFLQTKNWEALGTPEGHVVSIYTDIVSAERAKRIGEKLGPVEMTITSDTAHAGEMQHYALITEIGKCIATGSAMIMVSPDIFWGNGSLPNILNLLCAHDCCIAAPHPRVNRDEFLADLPEGDIENDQLVRLAVKNFHRTWRQTFLPAEFANCWGGGTSIQKVVPRLYAVHHHLPSVWLARFCNADLDFFKIHPKRGLWDHHWPATLVSERRQLVIGSSEVFFAAELTPKETNRPELFPVDPLNPIGYAGDREHHTANANLMAVWRSA